MIYNGNLRFKGDYLNEKDEMEKNITKKVKFILELKEEMEKEKNIFIIVNYYLEDI